MFIYEKALQLVLRYAMLVQSPVGWIFSSSVWHRYQPTSARDLGSYWFVPIMMMKSVESVRLLVILGNVLGQGWPTCGSRATCGSLKDYLWLSINVPEFPFHFCVIEFKKFNLWLTAPKGATPIN